MSSSLEIREAETSDLKRLLELYLHLSPNNVPFSSTSAEQVFSRFQRYPGSVVFLGELSEDLVSSCTVVVVPNLTRGGTPYALIENVVTHEGHRNRGFGKLVLERAVDHAWDFGCYKVMLMTGSKEMATLAFYERAGFQQSKTGFQIRRSIHGK